MKINNSCKNLSLGRKLNGNQERLLFRQADKKKT